MRNLRTLRPCPTLPMDIMVDEPDHQMRIISRDWRGLAIISERIRSYYTTIEDEKDIEINYYNL